MSLAQAPVWAALAAVVIYVLLALFRQQRLDYTDIPGISIALGAGVQLPAAIFLTIYGLYPDPPNVTTKLHHHEIDVAVAGILYLFTNVIALGRLYSDVFLRGRHTNGTVVPSGESSQNEPSRETNR